MSRVSTYLNFMGETEEAFNYYRSVFGTEFIGDITRMSDMPAGGVGPVPSEAEQRMVMHVELPILAGHVLMGTDMLESMGQQLRVGNNVTLNVDPDTRAVADKFYAALSEGGSEATGLQDMPWGAYWGLSRPVRRAMDVQLLRITSVGRGAPLGRDQRGGPGSGACCVGPAEPAFDDPGLWAWPGRWSPRSPARFGVMRSYARAS